MTSTIEQIKYTASINSLLQQLQSAQIIILNQAAQIAELQENTKSNETLIHTLRSAVVTDNSGKELPKL